MYKNNIPIDVNKNPITEPALNAVLNESSYLESSVSSVVIAMYVVLTLA